MTQSNSIEANVAILLATYNGEKYLKEFLLSLKSQTHSNITLIVRDDGSSDNTVNILEKNEFFKCRIFSSTSNIGAAKSFLFLLKEAGDNFDYYAFADQDDIWLPEKIERAVNQLKEFNEQPTLYCSGVEYVDANLNHLKKHKIPRKVGFGNALVENIAMGCTIVINRSARNLVCTRLPNQCLMHDWWLYLVISCLGIVIWHDYAGIKYRLHGKNTVGAETVFHKDIKARIIRFLKADNGIFQLSHQASYFYELFEDQIKEQDKKLIELIILGKKSIFYRIKLMCSKKIWRQSLFDNFIMRIILLINRY